MVTDRKPGALHPGWPGDENFTLALGAHVVIRKAVRPESEMSEEPERVRLYGGTRGIVIRREWMDSVGRKFVAAYEIERASDGESIGYFAVSELTPRPPLELLAEQAE